MKKWIIKTFFQENNNSMVVSYVVDKSTARLQFGCWPCGYVALFCIHCLQPSDQHQSVILNMYLLWLNFTIVYYRYCDCFANGEFCHNCNCTNCANNLEHEEERQKAIKSCLDRNPLAFHPKIGKGKHLCFLNLHGSNCIMNK